MTNLSENGEHIRLLINRPALVITDTSKKEVILSLTFL